MKEDHIYQQIILDFSDAESEKHLSECRACEELKSKVDSVMSVLDEEVEIPKNMAQTILAKQNTSTVRVVHKFSLAFYLQISLIIISGIFLGFVLGRNANTDIFQSDQAKFRKSLIEMREIYHLNIDKPTFILQ